MQLTPLYGYLFRCMHYSSNYLLTDMISDFKGYNRQQRIYRFKQFVFALFLLFQVGDSVFFSSIVFYKILFIITISEILSFKNIMKLCHRRNLNVLCLIITFQFFLFLFCVANIIIFGVCFAYILSDCFVHTMSVSACL